jgi:hypothetical protein
VCVGDGISDGVGVEFGVVIGKCVWDTVIYADADINGFTEWVSHWICNTHTITHGDTIWNLERLAVFFGHANVVHDRFCYSNADLICNAYCFADSHWQCDADIQCIEHAFAFAIYFFVTFTVFVCDTFTVCNVDTNAICDFVAFFVTHVVQFTDCDVDIIRESVSISHRHCFAFEDNVADADINAYPLGIRDAFSDRHTLRHPFWVSHRVVVSVCVGHAVNVWDCDIISVSNAFFISDTDTNTNTDADSVSVTDIVRVAINNTVAFSFRHCFTKLFGDGYTHTQRITISVWHRLDYGVYISNKH